MKSYILGSDWWTDCDDAVAIRILARAHRRGEINLLGVVLNACMEDSVASLDGFLSSEGVSVPIGLDSSATDFGGKPRYQKNLTKYAARYKTNDDAENAVRLYRRLLASAEEKVEIIEIGYLQAVADLLESKPDDISPLCGRELFESKVEKVWVMAGKWDDEPGRENNFIRNARSADGAYRFIQLCPVPITFLGYEIGDDVISGSKLPDGDVLRNLMIDHGSINGRSSWDPMTVIMALMGDEAEAGYDTVKGIATVDPITGENSFSKDPMGRHQYVIRKHPPRYYEEQIDALII
jgi:hypothetical protein